MKILDRVFVDSVLVQSLVTSRTLAAREIWDDSLCCYYVPPDEFCPVPAKEGH